MSNMCLPVRCITLLHSLYLHCPHFLWLARPQFSRSRTWIMHPNSLFLWLISVNPCFIRFHHKGVYSLWKDMSPPMRCDILQFIHSGCTKTIYFRLFPGFFQLKKGQMFTRLKGQGGRGELYSLVNTLQRLNRIQGSSGRDSLFSLTFFHYGPSAETGLTFH